MSFRDRKQQSQPPEEIHESQNTAFSQTVKEIDADTGELISYRSVTGSRIVKEPDYIKLYLDTMLAFQGIQDIPTDILIALGQNVTGYNNDDTTPLYFRYDKLTKMTMQKSLNIKESMLSKYIKRMCGCGILLKTDMRSVYVVNPWIIARGSWNSSISGLRAHFDFTDGTWKCDLMFKEMPDDK